MDMRTDGQLTEIVEQFVLRARRILAHSLCADDTGLTNLAGSAWYLTRRDGVESVSQRLPNEEALESLAARVRPLVLHDDGVHYNTVLNALSILAMRRGRQDYADWCKNVKKDWKSVDLKGGTAGYFLSVTVEDAETPPSEITDVGLANSWFYGDLVHADREKIDAGKSFGIEQRFAAAAVRTAQIAILARELFAFINALVEDEVIRVDGHVLHEIPVKVEPKEMQLAGLYTAPSGAVKPGPAGTPIGDAWKTAFPGTEDGDWIMRIPWGGEE